MKLKKDTGKGQYLALLHFASLRALSLFRLIELCS